MPGDGQSIVLKGDSIPFSSEDIEMTMLNTGYNMTLEEVEEVILLADKDIIFSVKTDDIEMELK